MVDIDDVVLKVDVLDGKPTEFGDSHACVKEDVESLVVLAVHIIVPAELKELPHLECRAKNTSYSLHSTVSSSVCL